MEKKLEMPTYDREDDPTPWVFKVERYFGVNKSTDSEKLKAARVRLGGSSLEVDKDPKLVANKCALRAGSRLQTELKFDPKAAPIQESLDNFSSLPFYIGIAC
ncbi:unnamed protein product [Dovyalis caffra]|uniref:Uncharacterized protein n=1 Tax=Dovyalis caffra TaxID=77055 RepID=A0AAV1SML0_9ROSI|nr:unnamed protein product [Dovyalis caffra]